MADIPQIAVVASVVLSMFLGRRSAISSSQNVLSFLPFSLALPKQSPGLFGFRSFS